VALQIRELLEKLLDDDEDMRDMNLSARCAPATTWLPSQSSGACSCPLLFSTHMFLETLVVSCTRLHDATRHRIFLDTLI